MTPKIITIYERYKKHSNHPLFDKVQQILKTFNISDKQIADFDISDDPPRISVGFYMGSKLYYVQLTHEDT
jgi:hypothetical protein